MFYYRIRLSLQNQRVTVYPKKRLIPIMLAGLFVYPLLYQSVHTVLHHGSELHRPTEHVCCHADGSAEGSSLFSLSTVDESLCPVCDYHFSFSTPLPFISFRSFECIVSGKVTDLYRSFTITSALTALSPRAPPC